MFFVLLLIRVASNPKLAFSDTRSLADGVVNTILSFVWSLVNSYVITPLKIMFGHPDKSAREFILAWVRGKLPHRNITNFESDWEDGLAVCELVNVIQPGLIPPKLYADKSNREGNAKLGMQIAHDAFGIPQLISPFDLAASLLDELSLVTYIALFCKYESLLKGNGGKLAGASRSQSHTQQTEPGCKAYGAGLKCSELGKVAEFVVELNGAKSTDITIAIECKPLQGSHEQDKPELSVKPLGKETYSVKYLPTRPGEYVISILHCGAHILRSPFYLTVTEPNGVSLAKSGAINSHDDVFVNGKGGDGHVNDKTDSSPGHQFNGQDNSSSGTPQSCSPRSTLSSEDDLARDALSPTSSLTEFNTSGVSSRTLYNKAEGPGLLAGEVGRVGRFTVLTDNSTKGPLSVCISCPAVSIPVPYVKSEKREHCTEHRVFYIPTEPGAYEIYIKWGELSILGSPFKVFINDVAPNDNDATHRGCDDGDLGGKGRICLYYAATSTSPKVRRDKELLGEFLSNKGICNQFDSWIALDVGMSRSEREKVFKKAGTRKTPMVFVNDQYIGGYEDIIIMDKQGLFDSYVK